MSAIVWIVLGLAAGLLANMLIPGRKQQGPVLLLAYHLVTGKSGRSRHTGWVAHR
jgi:uncharacterized membrane protein YeaQ/YmgE (transglycosylase-associated protein family)